MASPSVTNVFVNGNTADATAVNQNFTDLVNSLTDATKDLSISALTCAGSATLNGAVTLGNASGDDITISGSIAAHVVSKTTATYNLGSSSIGYLGVYQSAGASYTFSWLGSASASASYTLTVPTATGVVGQGMVVSAAGVLSWKPQQMDTSAKAAAYVVTDTDGIRTVLVTTGGTGRDITLPTASANTNRIITIKKVDAATDGSDIVTVKSDAAGETIDGVSGTTGIDLTFINCYITVQCDGSDWFIIGSKFTSPWESFTGVAVGGFTIGSQGLEFRRSGDSIELRGYFVSATVAASEFQIGMPKSYAVDNLNSNPIPVGKYTRDNATANGYGGMILTTDGDTYINMGAPAPATSNHASPANGNALFANDDIVYMNTDPIRISGWIS